MEEEMERLRVRHGGWPPGDCIFWTQQSKVTHLNSAAMTAHTRPVHTQVHTQDLLTLKPDKTPTWRAEVSLKLHP